MTHGPVQLQGGGTHSCFSHNSTAAGGAAAPRLKTKACVTCTDKHDQVMMEMHCMEEEEGLSDVNRQCCC